jgi:drug/metabolite transporter (DMT)-like permease
MDKKLGFVFAAISGACFGFLPIFAKLAYSHGGNPITVLGVRFTTAALIIWAICFIKKLDYKIGKNNIIFLILLGSIGYNSTTAAYFISLNHISAPLVSLIFYTNPVIVSVLSYFVFKESATKSKVTALILSSIGLMMIVGFSLGNVNLKGVLFAAMAAVFYSVYILAGEKTREFNPIVVTAYVTTGCSLTTGIAGIVSGSLIKMSFNAWTYSIMTAVFATVIAILTFYEAMKRIGPSQVAIISTIEPVVTTIMATILFSDYLSFPQIVGGVLVIAGIIVLQSPWKKDTGFPEDIYT